MIDLVFTSRYGYMPRHIAEALGRTVIDMRFTERQIGLRVTICSLLFLTMGLSFLMTLFSPHVYTLLSCVLYGSDLECYVYIKENGDTDSEYEPAIMRVPIYLSFLVFLAITFGIFAIVVGLWFMYRYHRREQIMRPPAFTNQLVWEIFKLQNDQVHPDYKEAKSLVSNIPACSPLQPNEIEQRKQEWLEMLNGTARSLIQQQQESKKTDKSMIWNLRANQAMALAYKWKSSPSHIQFGDVPFTADLIVKNFTSCDTDDPLGKKRDEGKLNYDRMSMDIYNVMRLYQQMEDHDFDAHFRALGG